MSPEPLKRTLNCLFLWEPAHESVFTVDPLTSLGHGDLSDGIYQIAIILPMWPDLPLAQHAKICVRQDRRTFSYVLQDGKAEEN
jgi:hypothetical protein